tara:strand:- start:283 stop:414 length:132 start_codon:yes stop_codon:yes gene_type:complete
MNVTLAREATAQLEVLLDTVGMHRHLGEALYAILGALQDALAR